MPDQLYQCCYTNTGQSISRNAQSGWQAVAVRGGGGVIPQAALDTCVRTQRTHATARTSAQTSRDGLYEILCDGTYLFVIRTCYGLQDSVGRSNSFSHGFIFPVNFSGKDNLPEENDITVIDDPNLFLGLKRENFVGGKPGDQIEDAAGLQKQAEKWNGSYRTLQKLPPLNLLTALTAAGLSDLEQYQTLCRCVYAQMVNTQDESPLHILCDGSEKQLRGLLYLIWSGLPFYLRRRFCAVSTPGVTDKQINVVFTTPMDERPKLFLNPRTMEGAETILTPTIRSRLERYRYLDYATQKLMEPEDISRFYAWIDEDAAVCGDPSNETFLQLATLHYRADHAELSISSEEYFPTDEFKDAYTELNKLLDTKNAEWAKNLLEKIDAELKKRSVQPKKKKKKESLRTARANDPMRIMPKNDRHIQEAEELPNIVAQKEAAARAAKDEAERRVREEEYQRAAAARAAQDAAERQARADEDQRSAAARAAQYAQNGPAQFPTGYTPDGPTPPAQSLQYHIFTPQGVYTDAERERLNHEPQPAATLINTIANVEATIGQKQKNSNLTIEMLQNLCHSLPSDAGSSRAVQIMILRAAWNIYLNEIRFRNGDEQGSYDDYSALVKEIWGDNDPSTNEALDDAKLVYWDTKNFPPTGQGPEKVQPVTPVASNDLMSLSLFSLKKSDFYREIQVKGHPNSDLFLSFDRLIHISAAKNDLSGNYLRKVNAFFANNSSWSMDFQKNTVWKLVECLRQERGDHEQLWYQKWIELMVEIGPVPPTGAYHNLIEQLIRIYDTLSGKHWKTFCNETLELIAHCKHQEYQNRSSIYINLFRQILANTCIEYEKETNGTPLDMWILLGELEYGKQRCFDMFDSGNVNSPAIKNNAKVMGQPMYWVVENSVLLHRADYREIAEKANLGMVKRWLTALDQSGTQNQNRRSNGGGLFGIGRKK